MHTYFEVTKDSEGLMSMTPSATKQRRSQETTSLKMAFFHNADMGHCYGQKLVAS